MHAVEVGVPQTQTVLVAALHQLKEEELVAKDPLLLY